MQQTLYFFLVSHTITDEQRNRMIDSFKALDLNNDGVLSQDELKTAFQNSNIKMTDMEIRELLNQIDNNKNQTIDYTEFMMAAIDKSKHINE